MVHQFDEECPIIKIENFPLGEVPTLHISYHFGQHFNSVRLFEDPGDGPAMPIGHELKIKESMIIKEVEEIKESSLSENPTVRI